MAAVTSKRFVVAAAAPAFSDFCGPRAAGPTWLVGRMSESGLGYDRGAARIRANVAPARIWTAAMGSSSHWLRVAGLLTALVIAGAGWSETQARSPRKEPPAWGTSLRLTP